MIGICTWVIKRYVVAHAAAAKKQKNINCGTCEDEYDQLAHFIGTVSSSRGQNA